jgi:hypothetical protein
MSERDSDTSGWFIFTLFVLGMFLVGYLIKTEINLRDNWIRDPQRRVGQLEEQLKQ